MSCDYCRPDTKLPCLCCGAPVLRESTETDCSIAWISVDDDLPKDDRLVLVWDKDWYDLARYDREDQGGCWKDITSFLRGVKFWAYLPEPPKQ